MGPPEGTLMGPPEGASMGPPEGASMGPSMGTGRGPPSGRTVKAVVGALGRHMRPPGRVEAGELGLKLPQRH